MADQSILFSGSMVLALLAGRKLQTRRLVNFEGVESVMDFVKVGTDKAGRNVYEMYDGNRKALSRPAGKHFVDYHYSPRIAVGDRLYVREAWKTFVSLNNVKPSDLWVKDGDRGAGIHYLADNMGMSLTRSGQRTTGERDVDDRAFGKYRPGMHMPKWASRMTLIVDDVKIERLQSITEADAIAEGVEPVYDDRSPGETLWKDYTINPDGTPHPHAIVPFLSAVSSYESLWNSINDKAPWDANPWVVAYTFRVFHTNIEDLAA